MFSKKKEPEKSLSPFPLEILTTEYRIEGMAAGDTQLFIPFGVEYWYPIILNSAKISAVGGDNSLVRTADTFEVKGDAVVAVIPRKDITSMPRYDSYSPFKVVMKGIFYLGPYVIEGTMMGVGSERFNAALLILDATIRHISSKSQLGELRAPHVLVNTHWLQGREVL